MQQRRFTDRTDANKWAAKQRPPEVPLRDIVLGLRLVKRLEGHTRRPFAVLPWIAAVRALVLRLVVGQAPLAFARHQPVRDRSEPAAR